MSSQNFMILTLLLKCCVYAHNEYWQNIFLNMSNGIVHPSLQLKNNILSYNLDNKTYNYKIEQNNKSENEIYNEIYNFLKIKIGKESKEKIDRENELYFIKKKTYGLYDNWKQITKKNDVKFYIEIYLVEQMKKYNLDKQHVINFQKYIYLPYIFRILCKFVKFCPKQNKIINIDCIKYNNSKLNYIEPINI